MKTEFTSGRPFRDDIVWKQAGHLVRMVDLSQSLHPDQTTSPLLTLLNSLLLPQLSSSHPGQTVQAICAAKPRARKSWLFKSWLFASCSPSTVISSWVLADEPLSSCTIARCDAPLCLLGWSIPPLVSLIDIFCTPRFRSHLIHRLRPSCATCAFPLSYFID